MISCWFGMVLLMAEDVLKLDMVLQDSSPVYEIYGDEDYMSDDLTC